MGAGLFGIVAQGAQNLLQPIKTAANVGMGMLMNKYNDKRQLEQQGKLNEQQLGIDKQAMDYSYQKQMEMWKATNYGAQREEMIKAGLNPGLMYGMGGGGGTTTGSGSMPHVSGGQAPSGGGEIMAIANLKMQQEMMSVQKEVMLSQAEKNRAEAAKTAGVDTEEAGKRIESLSQGIENAKAAEILTKADVYLKNLEAIKQEGSMEDQLDQIHWNAKQAMNQVKLAEQEVYINSKVVDSKIAIIRQEAIGAGLRNLLTKAQTTQTGAQTTLTNAQVEKVVSDIRLNESTINKMITELSQEWYSLSQKDKEIKIKTFEAELKEKYPGLMNVAGKELDQFIENIMELTPRKGWQPKGVK